MNKKIFSFLYMLLNIAEEMTVDEFTITITLPFINI